jgi:predicted glycosyltransferase
MNKMRILIDIGHPGHVHLLKNCYFELIKNNHTVLVTVKDLPSAKKLLDLYKINYIELGSKRDSIFQKGLSQLKYNFKIFRIVKKHKIDIGIGSSITLAHISKITSMKSILLDDDDDEVEPLFVKYAHPYADILLSPDVLKGKRKKKDTIYYAGYHELAYLHPNIFKPNVNVLNELGIDENEKFFIMRFNIFKAHHDVDVFGLSLEQKLELVKLLEPFGKIFITTEREIESELKKYQLILSPEKTHSLMSYATMFLGDSQTMSSEAAVLGVPAIRCNTLAGQISYLEEEEHKYGLTYGFKPQNFQKLLEKVQDLLQNKNLKLDWQQKRKIMLNDKIDVSKFLTWFIENFPESKQIIENDIEYQFNFK